MIKRAGRRQKVFQSALCLIVFISPLTHLAGGSGPSALAKAPITTRLPGEGRPSVKSLNRIDELTIKLESAAKKGTPADIADAHYQLGQAYFECGRADKAEAHLKQSLSFEEKTGRTSHALQVRIALGHLFMATKRSDLAMEMYRQALKKARHSKNKGDVASVLDNMASVLLMAGEVEKAEEILQNAIEIASQDSAHDVKACALINLAAVSSLRKNHKKALLEAAEAIALIKPTDEVRTLGLALRQKGRIHTQLGEFDRAIDCYREAARCFEEDVEPVLKAEVLISIGQIRLAQRLPGQAKDELTAAIEILKAEDSERDLIQALIALGAAEADMANFSAAEKLHGEAISLAGSRGDLRGQMMAAAEAGFDLLLQGKPERALSKFQKAQSLMEKAGRVTDEDRGQILRDLGLCFRSLGQTDAAVKYYSEALEAFNSGGDFENEALMLNSIAVAHLDSGNKKEFEKFFQRAKELASRGSGQALAAVLAYNYGQFLYMSRDYAKASESYRESVERAKKAQDTKTEGMALTGLGLALIKLGMGGEAKDCFLKSSALAEKVGALEGRWDAALGLGKTHRLLGDGRGAEAALRQAVQLVETERSNLTRDTFKTFSLDQRQECFLELIDLLSEQKRADEALEIAEKGRARSFLDLIEGRLINRSSGLAATVIEGEVKAEGEPESTTLVAMAPPDTASRVRSIRIKPKATTLVEPSALSTVAVDPPTIQEIKDLVARDRSEVIEYVLLKDRVLIFTISPSGEIKLAPPVVISQAELRDKIASLHDSITKSAANMKELNLLERKRQSQLKELYRLLIAPCLPLLSNDAGMTLTIVPHGPLFSVPFASLIDEDDRFLVEKRTISYLPAVGVLRATEKLSGRLAEKGGETLLAFGNPVTQVIAFLGSLPYSEKEVKKVAELFGDRARIETGASATKSAFKKEAPESTFIHLATHGLIDEERPMDSALVLAPEKDDDGLLTVKDILELPPLKAKMVVLSACQTGRGKITGDGVVGLSRAFIIAGAPSVIVSQWNVDDVMTEFQMEQFYKSFLSGRDRARALREAQLKTIEYMEQESGGAPATTSTASDPQKEKIRANPRLWAAFQLIGEHK